MLPLQCVVDLCDDIHYLDRKCQEVINPLTLAPFLVRGALEVSASINVNLQLVTQYGMFSF